METDYSSLEIVTLKREEFPQLARLFYVVWGGNYDRILSKTKWAFGDGKSFVLVAKDKETGEIVGSRGAIYWPLQYDDQILNTYQFHSTCVHPEYRRMGVFSSLNKHFLVRASELGIYGVFNVSVEASKKGYQKLGWSYLPGFERLIMIANPMQVAFKSMQYVLKIGKLSDKRMEISNKIPCNENLLENLLETRNRIFSSKLLPFCLYDKESFMNRLSDGFAGYKYFFEEDSLVVYKLVNKRSTFTGLLVGDIFLSEPSLVLFKKIIKKLIQIEKPDFVLTYVSNKHPNYRYFKKSGFFSAFKKDMNFGTRIVDPSGNDYFGKTVWQTSIFDIDTF